MSLKTLLTSGGFTNWIIFFLDSLKTLSAKLEIKIQSLNQEKSVYLNERRKQIICFVKARELCKIGQGVILIEKI